MPDNPFSGPFAGPSTTGGNPLDDERNLRHVCPKCKSDNFRAWTNMYGIQRHCNACGEEWSGSSVAVASMSYAEPLMPDGSVAPDIDLPVVQYTGAGFRDPSKTFGDDDY